MKTLVFKIIMMGVLVAIGYAALWATPANPQFVYASVIDKHQRLQNLESPKIMVVGGSGIALGLDSHLLEKSLNLPVVNMGVNGGFGLSYMLEEVKPFVNPNDLVIVVPEYDYFFGTALNGDQNLLWVLTVFPEAFRYIKPQQYVQLISKIPVFMQARFLEILSPKVDPIYNRNSFNERGDFVGHLQFPSSKINLYSLGKAETFNPETVAAIQEFQKTVEDKGATVVILFPAITEDFSVYEDNQQSIQQVKDQLSNSTTAKILSTPQDFVMPAEYFFDTVYHLNAEGRQIRTRKLVQELQQEMTREMTVSK